MYARLTFQTYAVLSEQKLGKKENIYFKFWSWRMFIFLYVWLVLKEMRLTVWHFPVLAGVLPNSQQRVFSKETTKKTRIFPKQGHEKMYYICDTQLEGYCLYVHLPVVISIIITYFSHWKRKACFHYQLWQLISSINFFTK